MTMMHILIKWLCVALFVSVFTDVSHKLTANTIKNNESPFMFLPAAAATDDVDGADSNTDLDQEEEEEQAGSKSKELVPEDTSLPALSLDNLDIDEFRKNVKNGKWFIKFYAPWCRHCQALAPVWDKLAKTVHSGSYAHSGSHDVNVAKLDCTKQPDTCAALGIAGYPSLQFFDNENQVGYKNIRDYNTLLAFVERAVQPSMTEIFTEEQLHEATTAHNVVFVTLLKEKKVDTAASVAVTAEKSEDPWENALASYAESTKFLAHHYFTRVPSLVKEIRDTVPTGVTAAAVVVMKEGDVTRYTGGAQQLMVAEFVKQNQFPRIANMTHLLATTMKKEYPKVRLLMILAHPDLDLTPFLEQMKELTKLKEFTGKFQFILMDAKKWRLTVELKWPQLVDSSSKIPSIIAMDTQTQAHHVFPESCVGDDFNVDSEAVIDQMRNVVRNNVTWEGGKDALARVRSTIFNAVEGVLVSFAAMQAEYPTLIHMSVASTLMLIVVYGKSTFFPSATQLAEQQRVKKEE